MQPADIRIWKIWNICRKRCKALELFKDKRVSDQGIIEDSPEDPAKAVLFLANNGEVKVMKNFQV